LSKLFRRYLTDSNQCNAQFDASNSNNPLEAARKAGQIVPTIYDMATGSFTGPLVSQTAYLISVGECNASHADNYGTKRVAIFSSGVLFADLDVDFKDNIVLKTDLNNDGVEELLMSSGDTHQGIVTEMAALLSFQSGRVKVLEDFGVVSEDFCASLEPGSIAKASVISMIAAGPGKPPKLHIDNYSTGCKAKRWKFLSTGKMQD
jgi:hypothetical protein